MKFTEPFRFSDTGKPYGHGVAVGKFLPAHCGHEYMLTFGASMCDHLTIVVDCVPDEWPSSEVRAEAMRADLAHLPNVTVVAVTSPTPQEPGDHPDFWNIWRNLMVEACGRMPDVLVCSMDYGLPLSEAIGCEFLPMDIDREAVPLSATLIRPDAWARWDDMLPHARQHLLARIAVEGAESSGKSFISRKVAREMGFGYSPEWANTFIGQRARAGRNFARDDLPLVAMAQIAQDRALELKVSHALISDSSALSTVVWSEFLHGHADDRLLRIFEAEESRAPRHRWVFTPEVPWVPAAHRNVAEAADKDETRWRFHDALMTKLEHLGLPYEVLPGGFADKAAKAFKLARALGPPKRPEAMLASKVNPTVSPRR